MLQHDQAKVVRWGVASDALSTYDASLIHAVLLAAIRWASEDACNTECQKLLDLAWEESHTVEVRKRI